jgi:hypothetical protein
MFRVVYLFVFVVLVFGTPRDRAKALLARMTLAQKISMLHGSDVSFVHLFVSCFVDRSDVELRVVHRCLSLFYAFVLDAEKCGI